MTAIVYALGGTGITFLATALGAAMVFLFRQKVNESVQGAFLGFSAGIMIAAAVWSLLIPSIEMSESMGRLSFVPAAAGFVLGGAFLFALDHILPHLHPGTNLTEGPPSNLKRSTMLVLAVTFHNIPEGMAVGIAFAAAASGGSLAGAIALTIGIAIQNFPEGAAISLPLKKEGLSNEKAFFLGAMSGIVEPLGGMAAALVAGWLTAVMPWILAFSAGAMMYVVAEDLIPEANMTKYSHAGTIGVMLGFLIMMVLDVALG